MKSLTSDFAPEEKPLLEEKTLRAMLEALEEELQREEVEVSLYVVGGAAIMLSPEGLNPARRTEDFDAKVTPKSKAALEKFYECAERVGTRFGYPRNWLNEDCHGAIPGHEPPFKKGEALHITFATSRELLAMKVIARRFKDAEDLKLLMKRCEITQKGQLRRVLLDFYGTEKGLEEIAYRQGVSVESLIDQAFLTAGMSYADNFSMGFFDEAEDEVDETHLPPKHPTGERRSVHLNHQGEWVPCRATERPCPRGGTSGS